MMLSIKMCNFAKDRLRLNKECQLSLSSARAIFTGNRMHLCK